MALNLFRAISATIRFMRAQSLLGRGEYEAAWQQLASLHPDTEGLPVQNTFRVEVDLLSSLAAFRLGDWNLSLFHAHAAAAGLRRDPSRITPTRDYLLYYCRNLIEHASWRLGSRPEDSTGLPDVSFSNLRIDRVPRDIRARFPVEDPSLASAAHV